MLANELRILIIKITSVTLGYTTPKERIKTKAKGASVIGKYATLSRDAQDKFLNESGEVEW